MLWMVIVLQLVLIAGLLWTARAVRRLQTDMTALLQSDAEWTVRQAAIRVALTSPELQQQVRARVAARLGRLS